MNYPVWEIPNIGGGNLIALISILHVFVAHLAVGGGLYIWLLDLKGYQENDHQIHSYLKGYTWFFLLLTMVFGGLTGVGIWFIIALVHPSATSVLIHTFVYGWAIEWVFFLGEIVSLLVYHYRFDKLLPRERKLISFLYFIFAFLSLVVINGILSFMLTPDRWLETRDFWDGFLNRSFFPSTIFRAFFAVVVAGIFGYVTCLRMKDERLKVKIARFSGKLILFSLPVIVFSGIWYYEILPEQIKYRNFVLNYQSHIFVKFLLVSTSLLIAFGIIITFVRVTLIRFITGVLIIPIGLLWMAGFEYLREIARKPFIIHGHMYSDSVLVSDGDLLEDKGILSSARWVQKNGPERDMLNILCFSCHTMDGPRNSLRGVLAGIPITGIQAYLRGQGRLFEYMPRFHGNPSELKAVSLHLSQRLGASEDGAEGGEMDPARNIKIPFFSMESDFVLLAWSVLGMHCISNADRYFSILPPGNTLEAILIRRGRTPEILTKDVELFYEVEEGFEEPANRTEFWRFSRALYGKELKEGVGLVGKGLKGQMVYDSSRNSFVAEALPVLPYDKGGNFMPYPVFRISARAVGTGEILAETCVVSGVSTEMGCNKCHGGGWKERSKTGLSDKTATRILSLHDKRNKTGLLKEAQEGRPKACSSCHQTPSSMLKGKEGLLGLSAAVHGFHAVYMPLEGENACGMCHPSSKEGVTRCMRDLHYKKGLSCPDCHGDLSWHALSLLEGEKEKKASKRLKEAIRAGRSYTGVLPRRAWEDAPQCLKCHKDFGPPEMPDLVPVEKGRTYQGGLDDAGLRCMACHGSTHALYPAENPYDPLRDNLVPLQYGKKAMPIGAEGTCWVCHKEDMQDSIHHPNMGRSVKGK